MLIINEITWEESLSTCSDNLAPARYRLEGVRQEDPYYCQVQAMLAKRYVFHFSQACLSLVLSWLRICWITLASGLTKPPPPATGCDLQDS